MDSTQPNLICVGWVELDFFNPPWWVGSKNPLNPTQPEPCTLIYWFEKSEDCLVLKLAITLFI